MSSIALRSILLATALFVQAVWPAGAKTARDDGPTLAVHVTRCPFGVSSAFDLACSITPAAGFLVQVDPQAPAAATDARGDVIAPLFMDDTGQVSIEVIPPTSDAGVFNLDGFCGPDEVVLDVERADPEGEELTLIISVAEPADVACWISLIPLEEPERAATPAPAPDDAVTS